MRYPDDYETDISKTSTESRGYGMKWSGPYLGINWLPRKQPEPFPVPLLGGALIAMRRNVVAAVGGFDTGLDTWGSEDAELSFRLWTLGYRCVVVPDVDVAHLFRPKHPYRVEWESIIYNKLRLATLHFCEERRRCVTDELRRNGVFPAAFARLEASDAKARRAQLDALRRYDDDWFFENFHSYPTPGLTDIAAGCAGER
jgi:GT2 family glycosyltransferase